MLTDTKKESSGAASSVQRDGPTRRARASRGGRSLELNRRLDEATLGLLSALPGIVQP
jgi:hypothetical protein